jgi:hypothetical protein
MIKIQLDDKALEKLIGGNDEVCVELQNAVVQNFAKKFLKVKINKEVENTLKSHISSVVTNYFFEGGNTYHSPKLTQKMKDLIIKELDSEIAEHIKSIRSDIKDRFKTVADALTNSIKPTIESLNIEEIVRDEARSVIEKRLNK